MEHEDPRCNLRRKACPEAGCEELDGSVLPGLMAGVESQSWKFAKTYSRTTPHWYFLKEWNPNLYHKIVEAIETFGCDEEFQIFDSRKTYRCLYFDEHRYWVIEDVVNRTDRANWETPYLHKISDCSHEG